MEPAQNSVFGQLNYLFDQGDLPKIEAKCESVLQSDPDNPDALTFQAICLKHHGRHEQAMHNLTRALDNEPSNLYALIHRSHLYLIQEQYEEAKQDLEHLRSIFTEHKVAGKWQREHVEYVSKRESFIAKAIEDQQAMQAQVKVQMEEAQNSNSIFKIFERTDLKKLVRNMKTLCGTLLNKEEKSLGDLEQVRSRLKSSRIKLETRQILEKVDNQEKIENYKLMLARCLSHLNFTVDDVIDRKVALQSDDVKSILSHIALEWYDEFPLEEVLERYPWDGDSSLVFSRVIKYKDFFSDNPIEEFQHLFTLILEDEGFKETILDCANHTQVREFKEVNALEMIKKKVDWQVLDKIEKDEEILAFIHFDFIKLVILEDKIKEEMNMVQRIDKLFKILQNCNNMEHEIQQEKSVGDSNAPSQEIKEADSGATSDKFVVKSIFYITNKTYSYFKADTVTIRFENDINEPYEFQFSGEPFEGDVEWEIPKKLKEIKLVIGIQGLFYHERKLTIFTEKLKKKKMTYFDIKKSEDVTAKRSGSLGLYIK